MAEGRLMGIARHSRPRGPIETVDQAAITTQHGVAGDCRGLIGQGKSGRRQISLIEAESWAAAIAELGQGSELAWWNRRANLLTQGIRLPRTVGAVIAVGQSLRIEVTCECDPCSRMEELAPGLKAALAPDWRGGVLGRVIADGEVAVGDTIRIET